MSAIIFQLSIVILLLIGALQLFYSLRRDGRKEWNEIMEGLIVQQGRVARMTYCLGYSDGLDVPEGEVWARLKGRRGLFSLFINTGVVLEAVAYLQRSCILTGYCRRRLEALQNDAKNVRIDAALCLLRMAMKWRREQEDVIVIETAQKYIALIAQLTLAINDFSPELLQRYLYYLSKS